jgi:hypothetical protein
MPALTIVNARGSRRNPHPLGPCAKQLLDAPAFGALYIVGVLLAPANGEKHRPPCAYHHGGPPRAQSAACDPRRPASTIGPDAAHAPTPRDPSRPKPKEPHTTPHPGHHMSPNQQTKKDTRHHMHTTKKIILAALAAMTLLALLGGTAAALRSLSVTERVITLLSRALTLAGAVNVVCEVGMTITLAANPIAKGPRNNIGSASVKVLGQEAGRERCTENTARVLRPEGPYGVNYLSFTGTLPNITGLNLQLLQVPFQVVGPLGIRCLITSTVLGTQRVNATTGKLENLASPFTTSNSRFEGGFGCPREEGEISFRGTFEPVGTAVSVRLV